MLVPFTTSINFPSVKAQEYGAYDDYGDNDMYSQYPTDDNKYQCRTGPFEGFFVSSVEFCKFNKFDDRKDKDRKDTNNITGTQGPPGPSGVVNASKAYVVWEDESTPDGNFDVFFRASQTSDTINLSNSTESSSGPQISSSGNNVYVVWIDGTFPNLDTFFAFSTDNGLTFSTPDNLSEENTGRSEDPQISLEGNNVYVVWEDNTPGNSDIFFAFSTDNGQTFSTPDNLSQNTGDSEDPQISSEGNNVYVVWIDTTDGNVDIFYTTNNQDFGLFGTPLNLSHNAGESFDPQISSSP